MSKKNRERRTGEPGAASSEPGGAGVGFNWVPAVLAVVALGFGFMAWTDAKKFKDDIGRRLADLDGRVLQVQKDVANAAKSKPAPQQGPDPNKVYTVRTEGSPAKGNATAPIVIAEFSDYQ